MGWAVLYAEWSGVEWCGDLVGLFVDGVVVWVMRGC